MKMVAIGDFLTPREIKQCTELYKQLWNTGTFVSTVVRDVIKPNLAAINRKLGQENDPTYLAYAIEYAMMRAANGEKQ